MRGGAALAAAPQDGAGTRLLDAAEREARALAREPRPYAHALGRALSAGVARGRGQPERAAGLYAEAAQAFDALEMALHVAAMRWRQAEILRGDQGRALFEGADELMRERGVVRPDRLVAMLAPLRTS